MSDASAPIPRQTSADTQRLLDQAASVYFEAQRIHRETKHAEIRAQPCSRCGNVNGSSCCGEADRVIFPCTNYIEGQGVR